MIIDGVLGSEAIDSSGEVLDVKGADISDVDKGTCLLNWEHTPGEKGPSSQVGVVLAAKKIYKRDDCENDRQRKYWDEVQLPFIYGVCRLYDGAGHEEAKRIAAIIRDHAANNEPIVCRYSVEGATLRKEDNKLASSVVRRVAVTVKPCNRTAVSGLIEDPNAPDGFEKKHTKEKTRDLLDFDETEKSEFSDPMFQRLGKSFALIVNPMLDDTLSKAYTAGTGGAAPGTLTDGAALQKEDFGSKKVNKKAIALLRVYKGKDFNRTEFRAFAKTLLPEASDEFLDHFSDMAEDFHVKRGQLTKTEPAVKPGSPKSDGPVDLTRVHALDISLRKTAEELSDYDSSMIPTIHDVHYNVDGQERHAGRFVIHNNGLVHLEDHGGLLQTLLPEGPVTMNTISAIHNMKMSPHLRMSTVPVKIQKKKEEPAPESKPAAPRLPSVFEYQRAGHDHPHTLEVHNGQYMLDGESLTHPEVQAILDNHKSGAATIRYKSDGQSPMQKIQKMEEAFAQFSTMEKAQREFTTEEMVNHARQMEAMGHVPEGYSDSLNKMLHEDTLAPGIGNKAAATHFLAKRKPGVYVSMDGNDFGKINKAFGQHVGDNAITAFGAAARAASDEATPGVGKLFRTGGDEFVGHFPSHEHAAMFMRSVSQKLQDVPAIGGAHKLSFSFGLGTDPHMANHALIAAKTQKVHPTIGQPLYPAGQTPNLAHSLVPGHEGPLPVHDPQTEMMHQTMKAPATATPKPIPAPAKIPTPAAAA